MLCPLRLRLSAATKLFCHIQAGFSPRRYPLEASNHGLIAAMVRFCAGDVDGIYSSADHVSWPGVAAAALVNTHVWPVVSPEATVIVKLPPLVVLAPRTAA